MPSIAILGYPLHGKDIFLRSLLLSLANLHKVAPRAVCRPRDRATADRIADMLAPFRLGELPPSSPVAPAEPLRLYLSGLTGFAPVDLDLYVINGEPLDDPQLAHLLEPAVQADALWLVASLPDLEAEGRTLDDLYRCAQRICADGHRPPFGMPISLILSKADLLLNQPYALPKTLSTYLANDHLRNIDLIEARYLPLFEPAVAMRELRAIGDLLETFTLNTLPDGSRMMERAGKDGNFLEFCLTACVITESGPRPLRALDPLLLTLSRWAKREIPPPVIAHSDDRRIEVPALSPDSVFISYKRTDWDEFVHPLVDILHQHGIRYWVDQYLLEGGDDWLDEINRALATCRRMILCMSPAALESRHVKLEYRYFFNNAGAGKTLYPVMCRPTPLPAELQVINYYPYQRLPDLIDLLKRRPIGVR